MNQNISPLLQGILGSTEMARTFARERDVKEFQEMQFKEGQRQFDKQYELDTKRAGLYDAQIQATLSGQDLARKQFEAQDQTRQDKRRNQGINDLTGVLVGNELIDYDSGQVDVDRLFGNPQAMKQFVYTGNQYGFFKEALGVPQDQEFRIINVNQSKENPGAYDVVYRANGKTQTESMGREQVDGIVNQVGANVTRSGMGGAGYQARTDLANMEDPIMAAQNQGGWQEFLPQAAEQVPGPGQNPMQSRSGALSQLPGEQYVQARQQETRPQPVQNQPQTPEQVPESQPGFGEFPKEDPLSYVPEKASGTRTPLPSTPNKLLKEQGAEAMEATAQKTDFTEAQVAKAQELWKEHATHKRKARNATRNRIATTMLGTGQFTKQEALNYVQHGYATESSVNIAAASSKEVGEAASRLQKQRTDLQKSLLELQGMQLDNTRKGIDNRQASIDFKQSAQKFAIEVGDTFMSAMDEDWGDLPPGVRRQKAMQTYSTLELGSEKLQAMGFEVDLLDPKNFNKALGALNKNEGFKALRKSWFGPNVNTNDITLAYLSNESGLEQGKDMAQLLGEAEGWMGLSNVYAFLVATPVNATAQALGIREDAEVNEFVGYIGDLSRRTGVQPEEYLIDFMDWRQQAAQEGAEDISPEAYYEHQLATVSNE